MPGSFLYSKSFSGKDLTADTLVATFNLLDSNWINENWAYYFWVKVFNGLDTGGQSMFVVRAEVDGVEIATTTASKKNASADAVSCLIGPVPTASASTVKIYLGQGDNAADQSESGAVDVCDYLASHVQRWRDETPDVLYDGKVSTNVSTVDSLPDAASGLASAAQAYENNFAWPNCELNYQQPDYAPAKAGDILADPSRKLYLDASGYVRADDRDGEAIAKPGDAMALTGDERSTLAGVVDERLLDAGDATDLIASIVARIGNTNVDEASLVGMIRSDLERANGLLQGVKDVADASKTAAESADGKLPANTTAQLAKIETMRGTDNAMLASSYAAPDNAAAQAAKAAAESTDGKLTAARLGKLDRDLAHAGDAANYRATIDTSAIAAAVESAIINEGDSNAVLQAIVNKIAQANPSLDDLTLGAIASQVRTELTTELGRIDTAISSRSNHTAVAAGEAAAAKILDAPANKLVTDGGGRVTVGTNDDKTEYSLTSGERTSIGTSVWSASTRTLTSFGSLPQQIWEYSTRSLTSFGSLVAAVWGYATRTLTAGTKDTEIAALFSLLENDGSGNYFFSEEALQGSPNSTITQGQADQLNRIASAVLGGIPRVVSIQSKDGTLFAHRRGDTVKLSWDFPVSGGFRDFGDLSKLTFTSRDYFSDNAEMSVTSSGADLTDTDHELYITDSGTEDQKLHLVLLPSAQNNLSVTSNPNAFDVQAEYTDGEIKTLIAGGGTSKSGGTLPPGGHIIYQDQTR